MLVPGLALAPLALLALAAKRQKLPSISESDDLSRRKASSVEARKPSGAYESSRP